MPALPAEAVGLTGAAGAGPSFAGSGATASLQPQLPSPRVIVFGSAAMDITSSSPSVLHERTTTPGSITLSPGGVGRNLAHAAQNQLPAGEVQLVAAVGGERGRGLDALGSLLELTMLENDLRTDGMVRREGGRTAACNLVLENGGDLVSGIADMEIAATLTADEVSCKGDEPPLC